MLDFDASKLLIIGVVALVVIGPKDLPRVLRQVGQAVTKLRRMASDFQGQFMDAMKEADLDDLRKEVSKLKDSATLDVSFDPVADVRRELHGVLEPAAAASPALDPIADAAHAVAHDAATSDTLPAMETSNLALAAPEFSAVVPPGEASHGAEVPAGSQGDHAALASTAETSGSVGAPAPTDSSRRRKIIVPKRRAPGDRLSVARGGQSIMARSRPILPPRRDDFRT